jgi:hypothetical protein
MSHAWDRTHRNYQLAHQVADDFACSGMPSLTRWSGDIDTVFGDLAAFLRDVQVRWYTAFDAALDRVLEHRPPDPLVEISKVWTELADTLHPYRTLLDGFATHPALAEGDACHRERLIAMFGIDPSAVVGTAGTERRPRRRRGVAA